MLLLLISCVVFTARICILMRLGDNPGDDLILHLGSGDVCCVYPLNYIRIIYYFIKALMQLLKAV